MIADRDELWKPRCLRQGWHLPYVPSRFQQGAWKAHYLDCVTALNAACGLGVSARPAAPAAVRHGRDQAAVCMHSARAHHQLVNRVGVIMSTSLALRPLPAPAQLPTLSLPDAIVPVEDTAPGQRSLSAHTDESSPPPSAAPAIPEVIVFFSIRLVSRRGRSPATSAIPG